MNIKQSTIDSVLFWIAWAFSGGFIIQVVIEGKPTDSIIIGINILLLAGAWYSGKAAIREFNKLRSPISRI